MYEPRSNICWIIEKVREFQKISALLATQKPLDHKKLWKILKETGVPDHLTCLLRNLYTGQGATVTTLHSFLLLSNIPLYKYHMGLKFFNNPYSLVIQYLLNKDVLGFFIKEN